MLNNGKLGIAARPTKAGQSFSPKLSARRSDVAALQRAGHADTRLQLDREQLEQQCQKHCDALAAPRTKGQERREPALPLTDEERKAMVAKPDDICGLS